MADLHYFEDPLLIFTDSTLYGCHLDMNLDELEEFCNAQQYKYLMLFQNLYGLKKMGKFGESDPHFLKDWIDVEVLKASNKATWTPGRNRCQFPSTATIDIFYERFGHEDDPQFRIAEAAFSWTAEHK